VVVGGCKGWIGLIRRGVGRKGEVFRPPCLREWYIPSKKNQLRNGPNRLERKPPLDPTHSSASNRTRRGPFGPLSAGRMRRPREAGRRHVGPPPAPDTAASPDSGMKTGPAPAASPNFFVLARPPGFTPDGASRHPSHGFKEPWMSADATPNFHDDSRRIGSTSIASHLVDIARGPTPLAGPAREIPGRAVRSGGSMR